MDILRILGLGMALGMLAGYVWLGWTIWRSRGETLSERLRREGQDVEGL